MGCGKAFKWVLPVLGIAAAVFAPALLPGLFGAEAGAGAGVAGALAEGGAASAVGGGVLAGEGVLGSALAGAGVEGLAGASTLGAAGAAAGAGAGAVGAAAPGLFAGLGVKDVLSGVQAVSSLMSSGQKQPQADATTQTQLSAPKTQAETLYQQQLSPNSQNLSKDIGGGTGVGNLLSKMTDEKFMDKSGLLLSELFGGKKKLGAGGLA